MMAKIVDLPVVANHTSTPDFGLRETSESFSFIRSDSNPSEFYQVSHTECNCRAFRYRKNSDYKCKHIAQL